MPPFDDRSMDTVHKAIIFEDVSISFEGPPVLDGVSFELRRGETKVVLGVAGSGKSTILKLCLGLLKPDHGRIYVLGHDITTMSEEELFDLRSKVGIVFQESALFDSLNVRDNVAFRLMEEHLPPAEVEKRVREALSFVELERPLKSCPRSFPAACGGVSALLAPSLPSRKCCCMIRPPAAWIRSPQPRLLS